MAFRRKRFPTRSRKRVLPARLAARKKYTWLTVLNTHCEAILQTEEAEACGTIAVYEVLSNLRLQTGMFDRARVVRILGRLSFMPTLDYAGMDALQVYSAQSTIGFASRLGLRLGEVSTQSPFPAEMHQLRNDYDLSEGRWIKTWSHYWWPSSQAQLTSTLGTNLVYMPVAQCEVTATPGVSNTFAEGTGTITIETDCDVECFTCEQPPQNTISGYTAVAGALRPWDVPIDIKLSKYMRENQIMYLTHEWASQDVFLTGLTGRGIMALMGDLRILVEI